MEEKNIEKEKYGSLLIEKAGMILSLLNDKGIVIVDVIEVSGEYVGIIRYKRDIADDTMALFSDFYGIERENESDIIGKKKCIGFRKSPHIPIEMFILLTKNRIVGVEKGLALKNLYNYLINERHSYLLN